MESTGSDPTQWNSTMSNTSVAVDDRPVPKIVQRHASLASTPMWGRRGPPPAANAVVAPPAETPHQKVFRLVKEGKFEEAASAAARLVNAGDADGFFVYGHTAAFDRAKRWFEDSVRGAFRGASSHVHTVTPELAQILVGMNDGNRRVNAANLASIMRDIAGGRWQLNGSSFGISREGRTNDGQHRALGVLLTGKSIESTVVFGLNRESMETVDIGRKRTGADRLGISGVSEAVKKAAIAAMAFETYNGRKPTAAEADEYFCAHRELIEKASTLTGSNMRGVGPSAAGCAAVHLLLLGYPDADIRQFFVDVRAGEGNGKNDPRKTLSRAIFDSRYQLRLSREYWMAAIVNHFVALREGRKPTEVQYKAPIPKARPAARGV